MSEGIFNSDWCLYELKTAIDSQREVILVNVEGSKYGLNKVNSFIFYIFILISFTFQNRIKTFLLLKNVEQQSQLMENLFLSKIN